MSAYMCVCTQVEEFDAQSCTDICLTDMCAFYVCLYVCTQVEEFDAQSCTDIVFALALVGQHGPVRSWEGGDRDQVPRRLCARTHAHTHTHKHTPVSYTHLTLPTIYSV